MIARGLVGYALLCAALYAAVWKWSRMPAFDPLTPRERADVLAVLRDALDGKPPRAPAVSTPLAEVAVVQLWHHGRPVWRAEAHAATVGEAVAQAARELSGKSATLPRDGRLKVDLVRARAPIFTHLADRWSLFFAFSAVSGLDGLLLSLDGREAILVPDDLLVADALAGEHPLPQLELELGLDTTKVVGLALERLQLDSARYESTPHRWWRIRTDSFVESASGALPVVRGNVPGPPVTRESLVAAARAGGDYLVRHLDPEGHFDYLYDQIADHHEPRSGDYSLPRHGGANYFLAQLYGTTHDPAVKDAASRALYYLVAQSRGGCDRPDRACVGDSAQVDLGSTALALVAAAEYQRTTGERTFEPWARRLAGFILYMQLPSGDFRHLYWPDQDRRDEKERLPYYSGEAALALARLSALPQIPPADAARFAAAANRALEYLTGAYYDFFVGQFVYAEDHWTCLAADALWDHLDDAHRRRYADFCDGFAAFLRRMQFQPDEAMSRAAPDVVGAYGFSPLLPPHDTPVGSRSECSISVWRMDRKLGRASSRSTTETREQVLSAMQFLLGRQLRDDNAWLAPDPDEARGGIPQSDVKRQVRIDGIQHGGSALLRAIELL
jgi:hypothetical protein